MYAPPVKSAHESGRCGIPALGLPETFAQKRKPNPWGKIRWGHLEESCSGASSSAIMHKKKLHDMKREGAGLSNHIKLPWQSRSVQLHTNNARSMHWLPTINASTASKAPPQETARFAA